MANGEVFDRATEVTRVDKHATDYLLVLKLVFFVVLFLLLKLFQNAEMFLHVSVKDVGNEEFSKSSFLFRRQELEEITLLFFKDG